MGADGLRRLRSLSGEEEESDGVPSSGEELPPRFLTEVIGMNRRGAKDAETFPCSLPSACFAPLRFTPGGLLPASRIG